jgi:hypothetical protein
MNIPSDLPLANLRNYGAQVVGVGDGFVINRGDENLGPFAPHPSESAFASDSAAVTPISSRIFQASVGDFLAYGPQAAAIRDDKRISDSYKKEKFAALNDAASKKFDGHLQALRDANAAMDQTDARLYATPMLAKDDLAGLLADRERRDYLKSIPTTGRPRGELIRQLIEGEDTDLNLALLRSPLKPDPLLQDAALRGWRATVDKKDPERAAQFALGRSWNAWAERALAQIGGSLKMSFGR